MAALRLHATPALLTGPDAHHHGGRHCLALAEALSGGDPPGVPPAEASCHRVGDRSEATVERWLYATKRGEWPLIEVPPVARTPVQSRIDATCRRGMRWCRSEAAQAPAQAQVRPVLPLAQVLQAVPKQPADPVERVGLVSAPAKLLLLHAAADLINDLVPSLTTWKASSTCTASDR